LTPLLRVTAHFAQSLDGRIAVRGNTTLLSSPEGVLVAHRARAEHDAVLVGSETVRIDDPLLTVRACQGPNPKRVVLASTLDVPTRARIFAAGPGTLVIGAAGRASPIAAARLRSAGAEVRLVAARPDGLVSLPEALEALLDVGVRRLLVEGGARVLTAFLRARLIERVSIEIAPRWLGTEGLTAIGDLGATTDTEPFGLEDAQLVPVGRGFVITGRLSRTAEADVSRSSRLIATGKR
jgi:5-amino-6-(5-phosphoribosylamino)uracil reductase/diaminohydroxyphosphoribosylaminopyrimidine deaminase/5-amino-6-(5-phosphoribosylamino)uracil reductase